MRWRPLQCANFISRDAGKSRDIQWNPDAMRRHLAIGERTAVRVFRQLRRGRSLRGHSPFSLPFVFRRIVCRLLSLLQSTIPVIILVLSLWLQICRDSVLFKSSPGSLCFGPRSTFVRLLAFKVPAATTTSTAAELMRLPVTNAHLSRQLNSSPSSITA